MAGLECIVCSSLMTPFLLEGQRALCCPEGHGIWLEREQLVALTDDDVDEAMPAERDAAWHASDSNPIGMTTERFRNCPVCHETLRKDDWKYGSGVVVDVCDEHGIWVDPDEIERIEAWTEAWHGHVG